MKLNHIRLGLLIALLLFVCTTGFTYLFMEQMVESEQNTEDSLKTDRSGAEIEPVQKLNLPSLPFSIGIGSIVSLVAVAAWVGSSRVRGDAASLMLENGLGDMTLNDLEVVKDMMKAEKFTVAELTRKNPFSRQTVWRQVNKMIEEGLVEETREKKLPKSGRGKPSKVFRFKGGQMIE